MRKGNLTIHKLKQKPDALFIFFCRLIHWFVAIIYPLITFTSTHIFHVLHLQKCVFILLQCSFNRCANQSFTYVSRNKNLYFLFYKFGYSISLFYLYFQSSVLTLFPSFKSQFLIKYQISNDSFL